MHFAQQQDQQLQTGRTEYQNSLFGSFIDGNEDEFITESLRSGRITQQELDDRSNFETLEDLVKKINSEPFKHVTPNFPIAMELGRLSTRQGIYDYLADSNSKKNKPEEEVQIDPRYTDQFFSDSGTPQSGEMGQQSVVVTNLEIDSNLPPTVQTKFEYVPVILSILKEIDKNETLQSYLIEKWVSRYGNDKIVYFSDFVKWIGRRGVQRAPELKKPNDSDNRRICKEVTKQLNRVQIAKIMTILQKHNIASRSHQTLEDTNPIQLEDYGDDEFLVRSEVIQKYHIQKFEIPHPTVEKVSSNGNWLKHIPTITRETNLMREVVAILILMIQVKEIPSWIYNTNGLETTRRKLVEYSSMYRLLHRMISIIARNNDFKMSNQYIGILVSEVNNMIPFPMKMDLAKVIFENSKR